VISVTNNMHRPSGIPQLPNDPPLYSDEYPHDEGQYPRIYSTEDLLDDDLRSGYQEFFPSDDDALSRRRFWRRVQGFLILISLLGLIGLSVLFLPAYIGFRLPYLPVLAFNHSRLLTNENRRNVDFELFDRYLQYNTIYPGIYIDGVHVGDMTREAAMAAVNSVSPIHSGQFSYTITVDGQTYQVDSSMIPYERNTADVVDQAFALARGITYQEQSASATPFQARVDRALRLRSEPVALYTEITYDRAILRNLANDIARAHTYQSVNAAVSSFDFSTHQFSFTDDQNGSHLDAGEVYEAITSLLDQGILSGNIDLHPEIILASITKEELMNSFRKVSSFTTTTTKDRKRNTNILLSAQAINGKTVLPGDTFSFNDTTGKRTTDKGYQMAVAIAGGKNVPDVGGGVCQTSSTLFNAVAMANLEIVKRYPHAWPSSYVGKGLDATVNWPDLDFQFRNNSNSPIFIVATFSDRKLTVDIYGNTLPSGTTIQLDSEIIETMNPPTEVLYVQNPELPVGTTQPTVKARKGYIVDTYKVYYQGSQEVQREKLFTTTYKSYQETVEYN